MPKLGDRLFAIGPKGAWAALGVIHCMAVFAKPVFNTDMSTMNTVSQESMAAEKQLMTTWGDIFSKVFLSDRGRLTGGIAAKRGPAVG